MTMHNFKIAFALLSAVAFATSYTVTDAYATDPDWGATSGSWRTSATSTVP